MNRALVQQQEVTQQLLTVLSDPIQRQQFMQTFDQNLTALQQQQMQQQQPSVQRPNFPGGYAEQQPMTTNAYQQLRQVMSMGMPMDRPQEALQAWDSIPDASWRDLAYYLIQER